MSTQFDDVEIVRSKIVRELRATHTFANRRLQKSKFLSSTVNTHPSWESHRESPTYCFSILRTPACNTNGSESVPPVERYKVAMWAGSPAICQDDVSTNARAMIPACSSLILLLSERVRVMRRTQGLATLGL